MAKIYERSLSTIIALSGEDSTWMVHRLEIPRVGGYFFYYTIEFLWLLYNRSFVLSSEREKQIVDFIGTLLHRIHVELDIRMPSLLFTVFVTYFLEMREEAYKKKML